MAMIGLEIAACTLLVVAALASSYLLGQRRLIPPVRALARARHDVAAAECNAAEEEFRSASEALRTRAAEQDAEANRLAELEADLARRASVINADAQAAVATMSANIGIDPKRASATIAWQIAANYVTALAAGRTSALSRLNAEIARVEQNLFEVSVYLGGDLGSGAIQLTNPERQISVSHVKFAKGKLEDYLNALREEVRTREWPELAAAQEMLDDAAAALSKVCEPAG